MQVISASRRTDIPALYSRWFMRRIQAGYCLVVNPFSRQTVRVSLAPEDMIAILFWTRNPAPLIPHLAELDARGYRYYFSITITGYNRTLDRRTPPRDTAVRLFRRLAEQLGPDFVQWRYDPIILTDAMDADYHRRTFERLCTQLQGSTRRCLISFLQLYRKNREALEAAAARGIFQYGYLPIGNVPKAEHGRCLSLEEMHSLVADLGAMAAAQGIRVYSCCNDALVQPQANVYKAHCVDADTIAALRPDLNVKEILSPRPTRPHCGCYASLDIGAYDTCTHGCLYCYATRDATARAYLRQHDPESEWLGKGPPEDREGLAHALLRRPPKDSATSLLQ